MTSRNTGPFEGIRILDLTAIISGPMATMMLADQGAEVIKIEPPGMGDATRAMGTQRDGLSAIFHAANRNKRSVCVDLKSDRGIELVLRLCRDADVFVQNFRPGAAERMGLGEAVVRAAKPDIVYVSVAGFGFKGPYSQRKVYDPLIQAAVGMAWAQGQGRPEGEAELVRSIVCDKATALNVAQAIGAALFARERGAGGQHVKLSMLDSALAFQWPDVMWNHTLLGDGITATPDLASMFRITATKDGSILVVAGQDAEFEGVCKALGREDLLEEPKYKTLLDRMMHMPELIAWQDAAFAEMTSDEACRILDEHSVPCCKVNRLDEVFDDPQVEANGVLVEEEHPTGGSLRTVQPVAKFSATPSTLRRPAPALGEQSREVLLEAGWDEADVQELIDTGVIHEPPAS